MPTHTYYTTIKICVYGPYEYELSFLFIINSFAFFTLNVLLLLCAVLLNRVCSRKEFKKKNVKKGGKNRQKWSVKRCYEAKLTNESFDKKQTLVTYTTPNEVEINHH